jgi:hypothetical protein
VALVLLGARSVRKAATVLTLSGISRKRETLTEGAIWSGITDIAVVGDRKRRQVCVVTESGAQPPGLIAGLITGSNHRTGRSGAPELLSLYVRVVQTQCTPRNDLAATGVPTRVRH